VKTSKILYIGIKHSPESSLPAVPPAGAKPAWPCALRLTATDAVGLSSTSTVTVTNAAQGQAAPAVAILSPEANATLSGTIPVTIWAADDVWVDRVELSVNNQPLAALTERIDEQFTYQFNTNLYPNGPLTLTARAYDTRGIYAEDLVSVTANNSIFSLTASPELFTPDGDGIGDLLTVSAEFTGTSNWTLDLLKLPENTVARTFSGSGASLSQTWDGKDSSNAPAPESEYLARVILEGSGATASVPFRLQRVNRPPALTIHSPADQASITSPTNIVATIKDTDLISWKLEYTPLLADGAYDPAAFVQLASGTQPVINKSIAEFDPTQLKNDFYLLRLLAKDSENPEKQVLREVIVAGELKIGLFTLTFEDLTVPLGGLPIVITRTYSSIERFTKGEFSYGWKMGIRDIDLKEDGNRNVEITLPDGRRVCFRYDLTTQNPVTLRAVWKPEPGVYDKLEMQGDNRVLYDAWSGKILHVGVRS